MKILLLEHDIHDVGLLEYELKKEGPKFEMKVVENKHDYVEALKGYQPDVILADYALPTFDGLSAFKEKKNHAPDIPFIVVSGVIGEEKAVDLIKNGVTDYVLKESMYQLMPKIMRALQEAEDKKEKKIALAKLKTNEANYRQVFHLSPLPMMIFEPDTTKFLDVNEAALRQYGYTKEEILNLTAKDIRPIEDIPAFVELIKYLGDKPLLGRNAFRNKRKNGEVFKVHVQSSMIDFNGNPARLSIVNDITDRLNYIDAIEQQNQKLHEISHVQSTIVKQTLARLKDLEDCAIKANKDPKLNKTLEYIQITTLDLEETLSEVSLDTRYFGLNQ
ncbi:PAS domain S-box protein [Litoribacter populi]|uniref:PAS domain S-box protein n=1 Tax=Litoribacter populi TaxID=2598460 RepID=UPI00117FB2C8|nr:PAS domain S-box protein [Litoribacter populi]